jgi:hypothetical protein
MLRVIIMSNLKARGRVSEKTVEVYVIASVMEQSDAPYY